MLTPLGDLRLACNHPQLVLRKTTFNTHNINLFKKDRLTLFFHYSKIFFVNSSFVIHHFSD